MFKVRPYKKKFPGTKMDPARAWKYVISRGHEQVLPLTRPYLSILRSVLALLNELCYSVDPFEIPRKS